ncbi:MAG: hypothetical protein MK085_01070 [Phycisphaerales bacterium]|nr:hypothetical protein [Phycisphaerales bacterium]
MTKNRNVEFSWSIRTSCAGVAVCAVMLAAGCDCDKKLDRINEEMEYYRQARWACCQAIANNGGADAAVECFSRLNDDLADAQQASQEFYIACEQGNQEAMNNALRILRGLVADGDCPKPIVVTAAGAMNTVPVASGVHSIQFDLRVPERPIADVRDVVRPDRGVEIVGDEAFSNQGGRKLQGIITLDTEEGRFTLPASARVTWERRPTPFGQPDQAGFKPTSATVVANGPGGSIHLSLLEHSENDIALGADGVGLMQGAFAIENSLGMLSTLVEVAWLRFPVEMNEHGLSIVHDGMPGGDFAPTAPPRFADINGSGTVDNLDVRDFYEAFALGLADLNMDGHTNQDDELKFWDCWYAAREEI